MKKKQQQIMESSIAKDEEEEDRISGLSDDILCHILSFSDDTEEVVRTSLLSKRWRYLWISVPTIMISDKYLRRLYYSPELHARFMDFVNRVLRCNVVSCLRKLRLDFVEYYDNDLINDEVENSRISELMNAVISRSAEDFDIGFDPSLDVEFHSRYFTCNNNVRVLRLHGIVLDVPTRAYLRNLKILILEAIECNEVSMKNLLEGCPVLEELSFISEFYHSTKTLCVKSSSLKKLIIKTPSYDELGIVVDATNLERLELECYIEALYELSCFSSSAEVDLNLRTSTSESDLVEAVECGRKMDEILRKISNTQWMRLSEHTIECIQHTRLDNLPVFYFLTRMNLTMFGNDWKVLPYLLECSPNLLTLALTFTSGKYRNLPQYFRKPNFLMPYLQYVNLQDFKGCADGMKMVSYFLENATVLKKMSVGCDHSGSKHVEIIEKLLMFPKSSSACQIAIE